MNINEWIRKKLVQDSRFLRQALQDCFRFPQAVKQITVEDFNTPYNCGWLGHATTLHQFGGHWIITDPVLGDRIGPHLGKGVCLGPKRYFSCAMQPEQLPDLDLVLITHAHLDHLDRYSLGTLPLVNTLIAPQGCLELIRDKVNAQRFLEIGAGENIILELDGGDLAVHGIDVLHPGSRWRLDTHRKCAGYVIQDHSKTLLFIGDTAYTPSIENFLSSFTSIDLALLPIGGYQPFIHNHCTPEQAFSIAKGVKATHVFPHQHSTFCLSHEPLHEPIERFAKLSGIPLEHYLIGSVFSY